MRTAASQFVIRVARAVATLLLAGLLGGQLVRLSPGSDVADLELDPRMSRESIDALRRERLEATNPLAFVTGLIRGDAGSSTVFGQPVAELIRDRLPATARTVSAGLVYGWLAAVLVAATTAMHRRGLTTVAAIGFSGTLLSCPSAVLAVGCLLLRLPPSAAIAAIVFPRVFSHAHEQFRSVLTQPHVTMARSCGIGGARLFFYQVAPLAVEPMIALAGVSITLAAGASIPVEALADSPGLGQLTWRAALGRDMPLLVSTTLLLATVTVAANLICDAALLRIRVRRA
jgi:peptide/nickel transport system permease protein